MEFRKFVNMQVIYGCNITQGGFGYSVEDVALAGVRGGGQGRRGQNHARGPAMAAGRRWGQAWAAGQRPHG